MALPALLMIGKAASAVGTGVRMTKAAMKSKKTIDALMKAKKAAKTAKEKAAIAAKIAKAKGAPAAKKAAKSTMKAASATKKGAVAAGRTIAREYKRGRRN